MVERRISKDGKWILERQADGTITRIPAQGSQPPADPTFPFEGPKAAADLEGKTLGNQLTQIQIQKMLDDMKNGDKPELPKGYMWKDGVVGGEAVLIKGVPAPKAAGGPDQQKLANLRALERQIQEVRALYNRDLKGGNPLQALGEYLPFAENRAFDSAGKALAETGFGAFRVPGVGSQSDAEGARFVEAYAPSASDQDSVIEQKITNLENRLRDTYREMGIEPRQGGDTQSPAAQDSDRSAPLVGGGGENFDPQGGMALGTGNFTTDADKRAHAAMTAALRRGASVQELMQLNQDLGGIWNAAPIAEAVSYRDGTGRYANQGPQKGASFQMPATGQRSDFQKGANAFLMSAPGTALTTATNAAGFGALEAIAPDALERQRGANPVSAFAGDVAGIVGGTSLLAAGGKKLAGKLAPSLLTKGGRTGNVVRSVAPDAAYGALYGGITEGDPLTGAATAAAGSGAGQLLAKGGGKLLSGLRVSPSAQKLQQSGMENLTVGQMLGGIPKAFEDAGTSAPLLGDIINARRAEGLREFNLARLNDAGAPIGATITETGEDGLGQLMTQVRGAYDNATQGITAPLDNQFVADMQAAQLAGAKLPPDYQVRFNTMNRNRVGPIEDAGELTGETYQQAMRGLKSARSSAGQAAPGFEGDYRDALSLTMQGLTGQMQRAGGQRVIDGLASANTANRLGKTLEKAIAAAKNDAGGAGVQIFTPAQLNTAAYQSASKFPGARPFAEITDAAQEVLPSKIPDSGTARRGAGLLLPVSLGGTGAGVDMLAGGFTDSPHEGAAGGATLGAILALGGTKSGQKLLKKALFDRPAAVRRAGGIFGGRKGQKALGGAIAAPLLIQ